MNLGSNPDTHQVVEESVGLPSGTRPPSGSDVSTSSSPTVRQLCASWLDTAWDLRESTRQLYATTAKNHVYPRVGHLTATEVTPFVVRRFYADMLRDGVGRSTIATARSVLSGGMGLAVTDGLLDRNPVPGVAAPRPARQEVKPLTADQVMAIAGFITPRYRVAVLLSGFCGLRIGEVGGLRVEDVDFGRRRVSVRRAASDFGLGDVKTGSSRRSVGVPAFVMEELAEHLRRFPPTDDIRVFSTRRGGLLHTNSAWKPWSRAAELAGVPEARWHDLRHSAASFAIAAGAHPKVIQARLGHANIQTTLDRYGHLFDGMDDALASDLDRIARPGNLA
jgi:integrase